MILQKNEMLLFLMVISCSWIFVECRSDRTHVNGNEMFFKQSNMQISIPRYQKTVPILNANSLVKLKLEDLKKRPGQLLSYHLGRNESFLKIDNYGYLRFNDSATPRSLKSLSIFANKTYGNRTRRTKARIAVKIYKITSTFADLSFCEEHACFWDKIEYRVLEGSYSNKLIGDLRPPIYREFCPNYIVEYKLMNATDLVTIRNGQLFAKGTWDYDSLDKPGPGPFLQPEVSCAIKATDRIWSGVVKKNMDIRLVDLNDNPMQLVDNSSKIVFYRHVAHFYQGTTTSGMILIAWDQDTVHVNKQLKFSLLNDYDDIYDVKCIKKAEAYSKIPEHKTGIYCLLRYKKKGYMKRADNCVTLRLKETLYNSTEVSLDYEICAIVEKLRGQTEDSKPEEIASTRTPLMKKVVLATAPPGPPISDSVKRYPEVDKFIYAPEHFTKYIVKPSVDKGMIFRFQG